MAGDKDDKKGTVNGTSDGRVTGLHDPADPFQFLVGPATSNEFNTARLRLIPIACFRVEDIEFLFDSSFPLPTLQRAMSEFAALRESNKSVSGAPISIFGHADPSFEGNLKPPFSMGDDYNKVLSGRRAIATYALLIRDAASWDNLFSHHLGGDVWGEDSIRTMLDTVDPPETVGARQGQSQGAAGQSSSFPGSPNTGASDSAQSAKVRDIAHNSGQRQKLFLRYMDVLCGGLKLDGSRDFLAPTSPKDIKSKVQGCSRFNPLLLFKQEDERFFGSAFEQNDQEALAKRNGKNQPNRRVMILIFRKGSRVDPAKWPCPTALEGKAGCIKRFFSNGDTRRSTHILGSDRKFQETHDTFACRFYQRISDNSPCEQAAEFWVIRLLEAAQTPIGERRPLANLPFSVTGVGGGISEFSGTTDADGVLRVPVRDNPAVMQLLVAGTEVTVLGGSLEALHAGDIGVFQRLSNLGFGREELEKADAPALIVAMQKFQQLHGLSVEDEPSPQFRNRLRELHGS